MAPLPRPHLPDLPHLTLNPTSRPSSSLLSCAGVGLSGSVLGVRLLRRLLSWDPAQRPTAQQALAHAFFAVADPAPPYSDPDPSPPAADPSSPAGAETGPASEGAWGSGGGRAWDGQTEWEDAEAAGGQRVAWRSEEEALQACSRIPLGEQGWC